MYKHRFKQWHMSKYVKKGGIGQSSRGQDKAPQQPLPSVHRSDEGTLPRFLRPWDCLTACATLKSA